MHMSVTCSPAYPSPWQQSLGQPLHLSPLLLLLAPATLETAAAVASGWGLGVLLPLLLAVAAGLLYLMAGHG
jgi:hypothetical protein